MTKTAPKPRIAVVATAAAVLIAGAATWAVYNRSESTAPAARGAGSPPTTAAGAKPPAKTLDKPLWRELTRSQQAALKPLQPEWDGLDGMRKRRWLELSARFASMTPAEQQRVHERMRQWMRLTPAQRNLARENFNKTRKLDPGQKAATWESYKQLSEEEKRRLARAGAAPGAPALPHSPVIAAPTSCPPGAVRRGLSCMLPTPAAPATAASPTPAPPAAAPASNPAASATAAPSVQNAPNASSPSSASNATN
ncbi:DUF3106 domain-containing protein [Massilia sp. 9I]|uniref:DUF3106 domain-containing protein n=1 Tax=Massilia sp. 9I TaxID=2653152 RepID=UPI0012F15880|nr:DUF3106 domain-containing protein [Massilia sp. 9I]VXC76673.1 conserved hypothetical protein [Massilia sp. 9I]